MSPAIHGAVTAAAIRAHPAAAGGDDIPTNCWLAVLIAWALLGIIAVAVNKWGEP